MPKFITLRSDIDRIIQIFSSEIQEEQYIQREIYSPADKRLPINPILYFHPDSITTLESEGVLAILKIESHIDPTGPGFDGPPYYRVRVIAQKVHEKILAQNTISKEPPTPLPSDVNWKALPSSYLLEFDDGKKIEFDDTDKPSAQYFRLLIENHGLEVDHVSTIERIESLQNNTDVRNLKKTLLDKISHAVLTKRISIKSENHATYCLLISPKI